MATILIVDDDTALRSAIAMALADLGHQPKEAGDGDGALIWLSLHRADVVLLDLRMPGMDGMEVLRRIRAKPDAPPVADKRQHDRGDAAGSSRSFGQADRPRRSACAAVPDVA